MRSVELAVPPVIRKLRGDKESLSSWSFWKQGGISGTGIKIGIISDGVEDISEADRSGALPESVHVLSPGKGTEGTVILEVVHKVFGCRTLLHSAGNNKLEFNRALTLLSPKAARLSAMTLAG